MFHSYKRWHLPHVRLDAWACDELRFSSSCMWRGIGRCGDGDDDERLQQSFCTLTGMAKLTHPQRPSPESWATLRVIDYSRPSRRNRCRSCPRRTLLNFLMNVAAPLPIGVLKWRVDRRLDHVQQLDFVCIDSYIYKFEKDLEEVRGMKR